MKKIFTLLLLFTVAFVFAQEKAYEDGEWFEGDREEIDDFHLTDYEKGYLYDEEDVFRLFETDDYEWDHNGYSDNWCGIDEEDDNETRQKKWDNYKSKFPRVTSKEQFNFYN